MARDIDSIIKELDAGYNPSKQLIQQRIQALPSEADAEISGLKAQERDYYDNTIMSGARQRGLGFSGIPDGERARYGATQFLPAVARVRQGQNQSKLSLTEALNTLNREQRERAYSMREAELTREAQERAAAEERAARAAAAAAASSTPSWIEALLANNPAVQAAKKNTADAEARYQAWLKSQLRVTTTPTRTIQPASGIKLQGSSPKLQGSSPKLQGGTVRLQGGLSKPISGGLRVR